MKHSISGTIEILKAKRIKMFYFFTSHRHHGLDIVFATQNIDQVDIGIRRLCGVHYRLSKMSNIGLHSRVRGLMYSLMLWVSEQFLPLTVENWSIDKNIFKLYDSYKSPVIPGNERSRYCV